MEIGEQRADGPQLIGRVQENVGAPGPRLQWQTLRFENARRRGPDGYNPARRIDRAGTLDHIVEYRTALGQLSIAQMLQAHQAHRFQTQLLASGRFRRNQGLVGALGHLFQPM